MHNPNLVNCTTCLQSAVLRQREEITRLERTQSARDKFRMGDWDHVSDKSYRRSLDNNPLVAIYLNLVQEGLDLVWYWSVCDPIDGLTRRKGKTSSREEAIKQSEKMALNIGWENHDVESNSQRELH